MNIPAKKFRSPLTRSKEAGTNVLNAYHVVGQLLMLYSQAAKLNTEEELTSLWNGSMDLLINNIGNLYDFWSVSRQEGDYALSPPESPILMERIFRLSFRFSQISRSINEWTPSCRLPSIFLKCESRWQSVLNDFKKDHSAHSEIINCLTTDSQMRSQTLKAVLIAHGKSEKVYPTIREIDPHEGIEITIEDS